MTIDDAIETLDVHQEMLRLEGMSELYDAVKLGIEALKGIKKVRKTFRPYVEALLPGETKRKGVNDGKKMAC